MMLLYKRADSLCPDPVIAPKPSGGSDASLGFALSLTQALQNNLEESFFLFFNNIK